MRIQECKGTNISWISQIFIAKIAQNAASFRAKRYMFARNAELVYSARFCDLTKAFLRLTGRETLRSFLGVFGAQLLGL